MKKQNGITLVALVITIIVLLILAGVSISLALGQNGVLTRASQAVSANEKAKVLEELNMAVNEAQTAYFEEMITNASYRKGYAYYENKDTTAATTTVPQKDNDVFAHNCMGASEVGIKTLTGLSMEAGKLKGLTDNTGTLEGVYHSNGSKYYYKFKVDVDKGTVTLDGDPLEELPTGEPASYGL